MKKITREQTFAILKQKKYQTRQWNIFIEKNGIGDYGRDETYSHNGVPILKLVISFNSPKCVAYDMRGIK